MSDLKSWPKLPVSIDSFERLRSRGFYYVDKTLFIRDLLLDSSDAPLFTRPRRFGKTTVLSMLQTFFEKTNKNTAILFQGTEIEKAGSEFMDHQGQYPVIFLSFKDALGYSTQSILDGIRVVIEAECERHLRAMANAEGLCPYDLERMRHFVSTQASENELAQALNVLSVYLCDFHQREPVILIDEYDAPIRWAWTLRHKESDSYEKVAGFMRLLLSATLKGNNNRSYACLTGIESVAKAGGESGINNLTVYSVLDDHFAEYFGFTHEEVRALLNTFGMSDKYADICRWYQGYRFGQVEMFNPVSVLSCLKQNGKTGPYWAATSLNDTIGDALDYATPEVIADISRLLVPGGTVQAAISDTLAYPRLLKNPDAVFTLLLSTGYLTVSQAQKQSRHSRKRELTLEIPNAELHEVYEDQIFSRINDGASDNLRETYITLQDAVIAGDPGRMQEAIQKVLLYVLGPNDIGGKKKEDAYHMLLTGLLGPLMGNYVLASNGNAGAGRFDIALTPLNLGNPAIVIEVKAGNEQDQESLKVLAKKALTQIDKKQYLRNPYWPNVGKVFKYGVAFSKKDVEVMFEEETDSK